MITLGAIALGLAFPFAWWAVLGLAVTTHLVLDRWLGQ